MKNYVISLAVSHQRRAHITKQFDEQGIAFEFFDAVTPIHIDKLAKQFNIALAGTFLTNGEKACLLSHVCLWQKAIDDNLDYIAIFEDDIYLGQQAGTFLNNSAWLSSHDLHFVKTETFLQVRKVGKCIEVADKRQVCQLQEIHLGAAGYIISQKTAKALLDYISSLNIDTIQPLDHILFEQYLNKEIPVYQLKPALCAQAFILYPNQDNMPSSLQPERFLRKKNKPKRTLSAKLHGELCNAYRKTFGTLSRTKITFR